MNIKRFLRLYKNGFEMELSKVMTFRTSFILNSISLVLSGLIGPLTALLIYQVTPGFEGWTLPEILVFMGSIEVTFGLTHLFVLAFAWDTAEIIISGDFDTILLKPVNTIAYLISKFVDLDGIIQFINGLVIITVGLVLMNYIPSIIQVFYFGLLILCGFMLWFSFSLIIGGLSFKSARSGDWFDVFFSFAKIGEYPLNIYGPVMSFIFTFIIPLGVISYYPSAYLIGRFSDTLLIFALTGILLLINSSAIAFYYKMLKNYSSGGG